MTREQVREQIAEHLGMDPKYLFQVSRKGNFPRKQGGEWTFTPYQKGESKNTLTGHIGEAEEVQFIPLDSSIIVKDWDTRGSAINKKEFYTEHQITKQGDTVMMVTKGGELATMIGEENSIIETVYLYDPPSEEVVEFEPECDFQLMGDLEGKRYITLTHNLPNYLFSVIQFRPVEHAETWASIVRRNKQQGAPPVHGWRNRMLKAGTVETISKAMWTIRKMDDSIMLSTSSKDREAVPILFPGDYQVKVNLQYIDQDGNRKAENIEKVIEIDGLMPNYFNM